MCFSMTRPTPSSPLPAACATSHSCCHLRWVRNFSGAAWRRPRRSAHPGWMSLPLPAVPWRCSRGAVLPPSHIRQAALVQGLRLRNAESARHRAAAGISLPPSIDYSPGQIGGSRSMSLAEANLTRRKVVAAGIAGNVMEWYDFAVYGYFARTIGNLYFPVGDDHARTLAAFGAFAAGFLMRPLGAILFGYIGDRVGRGPSLLWSVVMMAAPTFCIGLLPTYNQIGLLAPILMILFRLMQGLAVGGEYTGSAVFLAETAHPDRRGFAAAWAPFGAISGILLGSLAGAIVLNVLPLEDVVAGGWRVPFLLGVVVGGVGFILRRRLPHD